MNLKNILRTLSALVILTILWNLIVSTQAEEEEYRYFVVTAYYSPLPNQNYYLTWDYEREKRLNGQGIAWASGKPVFSGMLAAPASYRFWTKIELEWVGVWVVEDRWGAIVPAWNRGYQHDRIDIWVWHGDKWLRRALYWGKRTIRGRVVSNTQATSINIQDFAAPTWVTANIAQQRNVPWVMFQSGNTQKVAQTVTVQQKTIPSNTIQIPALYLTGLWKDASCELVEELQDILIALSYLSEEAKTWVYDSNTITAIYKLQKEFEIVQSSSDVWAWYFWPSTRKKLRELYEVHLENIEEEKRYHAMIDELLETARNNASTEIASIWNPQLWDVSPQVRTLQVLLRELGYFDRADTAIFGTLTHEAIIALQLDKEIITHINDTWAWIFWPRTREVAIEELTRIYFQRILEEHEIYEEFIIRKQYTLKTA